MSMPFKKVLGTTSVLLGVLALAPAQSHAAQFFFGEDPNANESLPVPKSADAEQDFLSNLTGTGTEDFESFSDGETSPLNLAFPGAGTATLTGNSEIDTGQSGGRFPISGSKFLENSTTDFEIDFDQSVAAFGFYGTDNGDIGGDVTISYQNSSIPQQTLDVSGSPNGAALYSGTIASTPSEQFDGITIGNTAAGSDVFGFDDMTVGSQQQVEPIPYEAESTVGLLALGGLFFGRRWLKRRRQGAQQA